MQTSRKPGARRARRFLASAAWLPLALLSAGLPSPVQAQDAPEPYRNDDVYGVDLTTGSFNVKLLEGTIGPVDGGVSLVRYYGRGGYENNWTGVLNRKTVSGQQQVTLSFGNISDIFTLTGGTWVAAKGNGATLTEISHSMPYLKEYQYKSPDGTEIVFKTAALIAEVGETTGTVTVTSQYAGRGLPVSIKRPDGQKYSLSWAALKFARPVGGVWKPADQANYDVYVRFGGVSSASGYGFGFTYQFSGLFLNAPPAGWHVRTGATFSNRSQDMNPADKPTVTYSSPASNIDEITTASGEVWRFTRLSGYSRIVGIRRPGAAADTTTITYDTNGKVASVNEDGVTKTYGWSTSGTNTVVNTTEGGTDTGQAVSNPAVGQPTTVTDGTSQTVTYQYDANNRRTRTTMPEGDYVQATYDARGNVTETRAVAKSGSGLADIVTTANFDATCTNPAKCNKPNWTQDALGNRTDYSYDPAHGQVTKVQMPSPTADAAGTETGVRPEVNYSYTGLKAKILQGGVLVDSGDTQYKVTQITTCATAATCAGSADETRVTIAYNNNLLPSSVTAAAGDGSVSATTAYNYDARGNVASVDGPLAGADDTTHYFYGPNNLYFGTIAPDPDGAGARPRRAERRSYSAGSTLQTISIGTVTGTSWSDLTGMTALQTLSYTYDSDRNVIKEVTSTPSGTVGVVQHSYDAKKRLTCSAVRMNPATWSALPASACTAAATSTTFGPDRITRTSYDANDRVTKVETAVGSAEAADEVRTAYTANGRVDHVIDAESNRTTYIHDGFDRLSQTRYPSATKGANASNASDYDGLSYDANGNVTQRRLRDATVIGYGYDDLGRLVSKDLPGSEPDATYDHDLSGRLTGATQNGQTYGFGYDALGRNLVQSGWPGSLTATYDAAGRRTSLTYPGGGLTVGYSYDATGAMTEIRENPAGGNALLASFAYDDQGRRTSLTRGNGTVTSYTHDPASRLASLTQDLAGSAHDLTLGFSYNPAGQIAEATRSNDSYAWGAHYNVDRAYTANGLNQFTAAGGTGIGHDARGNLTSSGSDSYSYSSENILKIGPGGASAAYDPLGRLYFVGITAPWTYFGYDGVSRIAEYDSWGGVFRRYVHGPGIDEPLVWYEGAGTGDKRWLHADERGSIVSVSDGAGATIAVNSYDEYGNPAPGNVGAFGYTGQTWMPELGMWYYKARMYSPTLGRFMQSDPIGYGDGMNWYNYVGGDPVNFVDPLGLCTQMVGGEGPDGGKLYPPENCPKRGFFSPLLEMQFRMLDFYSFGQASVPVGSQPKSPEKKLDCAKLQRDAENAKKNAPYNSVNGTGVNTQAPTNRRWDSVKMLKNDRGHLSINISDAKFSRELAAVGGFSVGVAAKGAGGIPGIPVYQGGKGMAQATGVGATAAGFDAWIDGGVAAMEAGQRAIDARIAYLSAQNSGQCP